MKEIVMIQLYSVDKQDFCCLGKRKVKLYEFNQKELKKLPKEAKKLQKELRNFKETKQETSRKPNQRLPKELKQETSKETKQQASKTIK